MTSAANPPGTPHRSARSVLGADLAFLAGAGAVLAILQTLLRVLLYWRNRALADGIPGSTLAKALATGVRFDLIIVGYLLLLPALALLLPRGLRPRALWVAALTVASALIVFVGVVELDFYHEFHVRLNSLAFEYLRADPGTVSSMLWNGFPVLRYLALWLVLSLGAGWAYRKLDRITRPAPNARGTGWALRIPAVLVVLLVLGAASRGTLRFGPPLRWGDAYHSAFAFANHLGLNGVFTLAKAVAADAPEQSAHWLKAIPEVEALALTRTLVVTGSDQLLDAGTAPLLRRHTPAPRPGLHPGPRPRNLVFIIMESFSGEFVGALGHPHGVTPAFDRLADEGLLFERFFSNGTHTHQGMFASVACFPNLPGFEYLMQTPEGMHQFSGLRNLYVYNGSFSWDNQNGFFGNQGFTRFIGREDYVAPKFYDATWGVSDEDMFNRAATELAALPANRPFFAVLQTLSNHTPYHLPDPLPFAPVQGFGDLDQHLTAMKYSDWALGQFFEQARHAPWFDQTLFVVVGDHGFGTSTQVTDIDLARFHVPALLIGPGIRARFGAHSATVASQVDLVPTAISQLPPGG